MPFQSYFNGQSRMIEASCGFTCCGTVREANFKFTFHKKHCETCKQKNVTLSPFNESIGKSNGLKGTLKGRSFKDFTPTKQL